MYYSFNKSFVLHYNAAEYFLYTAYKPEFPLAYMFTIYYAINEPTNTQTLADVCNNVTALY